MTQDFIIHITIIFFSYIIKRINQSCNLAFYTVQVGDVLPGVGNKIRQVQSRSSESMEYYQIILVGPLTHAVKYYTQHARMYRWQKSGSARREAISKLIALWSPTQLLLYIIYVKIYTHKMHTYILCFMLISSTTHELKNYKFTEKFTNIGNMR